MSLKTSKNFERSLDEQIAEKVMGWKLDNKDHWQVLDENFDTDKATFTYGWIAPEDAIYLHESRHKNNVPLYSANLDTAWNVVEKIKTKTGLKFQLHELNNRGWIVQFHGHTCEEQYWVEGLPIPEAICRLALKVLDDLSQEKP